MRKTTKERAFDAMVRRTQEQAKLVQERAAWERTQQVLRFRQEQAHKAMQEYRRSEWRKCYLMLSDRAHALRAVVGLPNVAGKALGPLLEMVESYGALLDSREAVA